MSRGGRRLTPDEAALWARVASTVTPLEVRRDALLAFPSGVGPEVEPVQQASRMLKRPIPALPLKGRGPEMTSLGAHTLDATWDRKLARGLASPDFTLDLHGCTLDAAHSRLLHGLAQAKAMQARIVLLVTGRPRPVDSADRSNRRGAIRAKVVDWLAASEHAHDIAAIRGAHPRHGGQGALYVVLRRGR